MSVRHVPPGVVPVEPDPGQESVWDYPRPPRVEPVAARIRVVVDGPDLVSTGRAGRVLETAGAPVWYLPGDDVQAGLLRPVRGYRTHCEWKGEATYFDLVVGDATVRRAAWTYEHPSPGYEQLRERIAFYAGRVDVATVDGERARPQPGGFYGGWITDDVAGPFKGEPGTEGW
jgi:uncharacterized protein (DUF427 family)